MATGPLEVGERGLHQGQSFFRARGGAAADLGRWAGPLLRPLPWPGCGLGLFGAWLAMFADLLVRGAFFLARFAGGAWQHVRV